MGKTFIDQNYTLACILIYCIFFVLFRRSANDCLDLQPSWFDTLLPSNIGCVEINNYLVRANDLDATNTDGSSDKPFKLEHSKADEGMCGEVNLTWAWLMGALNGSKEGFFTISKSA